MERSQALAKQRLGDRGTLSPAPAERRREARDAPVEEGDSEDGDVPSVVVDSRHKAEIEKAARDFAKRFIGPGFDL